MRFEMSRLRLEEDLVKKEASLYELEDKPIAQLIQEVKEAAKITRMPEEEMPCMKEDSKW